MSWLKDKFMSHDEDEFLDRATGDLGWSLGTSGQRVDERTVLSIPAAYDAIQTIADPIKSMPLVFFERVSNTEKRRIDDSQIQDSFKIPNDFQNRVIFFEYMARNLLLYRNAFAEIISTQQGNIERYVPFHPNNVEAINENGMVIYRVQDGAQQRFVSSDRMWHMKSGPYTEDGLMGRGPMDTNKNTFSAALSTIDYGARFFKNDATAGGILEHPDILSKEAQENLKKSWRHAQGGKNRGSVAILEQGMKFNKISVTNNESQFIETRRQDAIEIARIWNVPPHKIKSLDNATFSNIEQQSLDFVIYTLQPWLSVFEASIKSDLIGFDNNVFAEFNIMGLLKGDIKTRFDAYAKGRNWGWLSVNEIRKLENMNPIEGGDEYLTPLNMRDSDDDAPSRNNVLKLAENKK